ncbi:MAG: O-antigen ligase family protein [Phycisphaeraceae bacterium]|nr:O-antigen ligase family protein [Phycisphaeraceae bacterium]
MNRPWMQEAFDLQRRDRLGLRVHLAIAMVACFATSFTESAFAIALPLVLSASVVRMTMTWRLWFYLLIQPTVIVGFAYMTWRAITLAWTPDLPTGVNQFQGSYHMLLLPALWPVMEYRTLLILAWAGGFLVGHGLQAAEALGLATGWEGLIWQRHAPGRISGWWSPAAGGTALVAMLGLHVWASVTGRGWWRRAAIAMAMITALGIVATGTRSGWLCAALLIAGFGVAAVSRRVSVGGVTRGRLALLLSGIVVVLGVGIGALYPLVRSRLQAAESDLKRALVETDYDSDTGARLLMWREAWRAFAAHPIAGVGEGGYMAWAREDLGDHPAAHRIQVHAHGTLPHVGATTGAIGLLLFGALAVSGLRCAWKQPERGVTGYERALLPAMIGLLLIAQFEVLQVAHLPKKSFWMMLALCPAFIPAQRWQGSSA